MKTISDKINIDQLATLFNLPTWEKLSDNFESDTFSYYYKHYLEEGMTESEAEQKAAQAESDEQDETFHKYHSAVMHVAEHFFDKHGLTLKACKVKGKEVEYAYEFKVVPVRSWNDSCKAILETINGVGFFTFNSLRDFLDSGPYSARTAALTHKHWIPDYSRVYGSDSPQRLYDRYVR